MYIQNFTNSLIPYIFNIITIRIFYHVRHNIQAAKELLRMKNLAELIKYIYSTKLTKCETRMPRSLSWRL